MKSHRLKLIVFGLLICLCLIIGNLPEVKSRLTIAWMNAQINTLHDIFNRPYYGPALFLLTTVVVILLQIPGMIMVVLAPLVYGIVKAFVLTIIACNIGMILTFLIGRYLLQDYFAPKLEKSVLNRFTGKTGQNGLMVMLFLRTTLWMFPPMNWLMAATGIKTRDYIIGTVIGVAPMILAVQLTIKKLQSIRSLSELVQPEIIILMGLLVTGLIIVALVRKKYFSTESSEGHERTHS